jgi:AraC-like DNA-binding protein
VRAFQVLSTSESARVSVLDFAGADVSIPVRFGEPVVIEGPEGSNVPSAALVGPRVRSVRAALRRRGGPTERSFYPGVAGAFVGLSMEDAVDRMASPDDVWPRDFIDAVADLEPLPVEERISRLSDLLLARLAPRREPGPQVREAVRLIYATRGRIRVRSLADEVNLSVSQLKRGFKRHGGVGPKLLARQTRLSALAAEATRTPRPDWAWLAYRFGFSDQAHLTREFGQLMGLAGGVRRRGAACRFSSRRRRLRE